MTLLARLVLGGFLLALGVAVASPAVKPRTFEMICSGGTMTLVAHAGTDASGPDALDCPLCLPGVAPVPAIVAVALPVPVHAPVLAPRPPAHRPALAAAPLPARGPPAARSALPS